MTTIVVQNFINKFKEDNSFFNQVLEFSFIKPLAEAIQSKGCECGLQDEIYQTTAVYNSLVENASKDLALKTAKAFGHDTICFGIVKRDGTFEVKCPCS